ncbi:hypothetical protein [Penaeicola halotolerans]|uniref:hypothetical protein n=1 Tax=Penaeicola halotolerans TaxID=2793196 RepID=UPI001CF84494|nr:hypothetical protein [Penaeicola halotolerans]
MEQTVKISTEKRQVKGSAIMDLKRVVLTLCLTMCFMGLQAQQNIASTLQKGAYENEWVLKHQLSMVDIYTKYADCTTPGHSFSPEIILVKVINKTSSKVYVYWNYALGYDNQVLESGADENLVQVSLDPNQSVEGSCGNYLENKLGVFVRFKNQEEILTRLILEGIHESKLN